MDTFCYDNIGIQFSTNGYNIKKTTNSVQKLEYQDLKIRLTLHLVKKKQFIVILQKIILLVQMFSKLIKLPPNPLPQSQLFKSVSIVKIKPTTNRFRDFFLFLLKSFFHFVNIRKHKHSYIYIIYILRKRYTIIVTSYYKIRYGADYLS